MKEQTLLEMKNKIASLTNVTQYMLSEISHLKELAVGSLETIKLLPGYDEAIEQLKKTMEENIEEKKKAQENGTSK